MRRYISSNQNILIYENTKHIAPVCDAPSTKQFLDIHHALPTETRSIRVEVVNGDTLDVAERFLVRTPLVMNLADDRVPGGCVEVGACSQEECLFRRTNLFKSLVPSLYPIRYNEAIYSPSISVFKRGENDLYASMPPFKVDFIACPGLKHPEIINGHLKENDRNTLLNKIRLIFQVANQFGHTVIVAGALGCGAWCNPPQDVASAFKQIIEEEENNNANRVTEVIFAILKPKPMGLYNPSWENNNFEVFNATFNGVSEVSPGIVFN